MAGLLDLLKLKEYNNNHLLIFIKNNGQKLINWLYWPGLYRQKLC
jgi:hypothetical protein